MISVQEEELRGAHLIQNSSQISKFDIFYIVGEDMRVNVCVYPGNSIWHPPPLPAVYCIHTTLASLGYFHCICICISICTFSLYYYLCQHLCVFFKLDYLG